MTLDHVYICFNDFYWQIYKNAVDITMPHDRLASLAMMPCAFDPLDTLGYGSVSNKDLVTCEKTCVCIYNI